MSDGRSSRGFTRRDRPAAFAYFSDLLTRRVVDAQGAPIGRLWDLSIRLGEPYPLVHQLFIRPRGPTELLLIAPGEQVRPGRSDPIPLVGAPLGAAARPPRGRDADPLARGAPRQAGAWTSRARRSSASTISRFLVVREGELVLAHIDVGLRGLVRRLGWEKRSTAPSASVRPRARYFARRGSSAGSTWCRRVADPAGLRLALSQKSIGAASTRRTSPRSSRTCRPQSRRSRLRRPRAGDGRARALRGRRPTVQEELLTRAERSARKPPTCSRRCPPTPPPTCSPSCRRRTRRTCSSGCSRRTRAPSRR